MFIGNSPEEIELGREVKASRKAKARPSSGVTLRLHRESDEHGDFFVAFLIRPQAPTDFLTFGSRNPNTARKLAESYAKGHKLAITKTIKTDEDDE